jgi:3-oxoacyl-[acyl-carrier-protein] synthase-1
MTVYLNQLGLLTPIGSDGATVLKSVQSGRRGLSPAQPELTEQARVVGAVCDALPELPVDFTHYQSRNNQLLYAAALQIECGISEVLALFGAHRVAIVVGTSTSGLAESEIAMAAKYNGQPTADNFNYLRQEMADPARFLAECFGVLGPAYVVSTACSSSARALLSAKRMLELGLVDAVICGGADTLCRTTLNGFSALDAISSEPCNPFNARRNGINIGEAAVLFLMSREPGGVVFLGGGASSDAHHISAPQPQGMGAADAMNSALADAELVADDIDYLNLHGTATLLNDAMESRAVRAVFGTDSPACSSTKSLTGHALGAAGALEAAICWLLLTHGGPAPQVCDGDFDQDMPLLNWRGAGQLGATRIAMSNSFAFGGNNVSLIFSRNEFVS